MHLYQVLDKADTLFTNERGEAMWGQIIQATQWYWSQMTLLSVLILIMIVAIASLTWITFSDRKKFASRCYQRGRKDEKNKQGSNYIQRKK